MEEGENRPRPGAPPELNSPLDILQELLEIERERLQVAVRIERERSIVFPETTVIIRDIQKLMAAIESIDCKAVNNNAVEKGTDGQSTWTPIEIEGAF